MELQEMSAAQLTEQKQELSRRYEEFKSRGLSLDMSRGQPCTEQFDLSNSMLGVLHDGDQCLCGNTDCRNYGVVDGLPELKQLFAGILDTSPEDVVVGGNSSLNMMFDVIAQGMTHGFGEGPWAGKQGLKFLCPSPGYDRHFSVTEYFGFELIAVEMTPDGPDMDAVERLVADPSVKGMWCVPKFSNPQGYVYSDDTVRRIAALRPAAKDFRIIWDNSYAVHSLFADVPLLPIQPECVKAGNPDLVIQFTSTSKISFAGAGVAALAASEGNRAFIKNRLGAQTIGPDKLNQLRHSLYFKNLDGVKQQMERHAAILRPKFEMVLSIFEKELAGVVSWNKPMGGYFISVDTMDGCASRVVTLCREAGVNLTPAGATYPYGKDPRDRNIRVAPTRPPVEELRIATELFCIAARLATVEKLLQQAQ